MTEPNRLKFSLLRRAVSTRHWTSRAGRLASIGLLVVLVTLPGFALWGATSTYWTGLEVRRSTKLNNIYEQARYSVGAEESLERKYRLEPSPEVRARHSAAGADMVEALRRAAEMGNQTERQLIQGVLATHKEYLGAISRMFAAVDAHDTEASNAIDGAEVDPNFDKIENQVVAMSDRHRADAADQLDALTAMQYKVAVATPVVFAFGAALVIFFSRLLRTVQRRAAEGLQAEDRFRHAMQAGRLGVWELDLCTMELTTSAMCKGNFGLEPNDVFAYAQFLACLDSADRVRFEASVEQSVEAGKDLDGEFHVKQHSGASGWVQMHARVVNPPDGRRRLAGISLDITERVRTEERMRHSQRVEALGRLTAGVAHDFNNVLQSLLGGIELAVEALADQPDVRSDLELALQSGRRGAKLTSHLLSFSRQQKLSPVALDLRLVLDDLARTLVRTLGPDITVSVSYSAGLPAVLADAAHLDSALLNLALNARDAMPGGGTLLIEAQALGNDVAVTVSDTGEGMLPEVLARACEPFFSTKGVKGSGLGLSMVMGFVQQSGGEMRIQSSSGCGTRIELRLPLANAPGETVAVLAAKPVTGAGYILLVDDQPEISRVVALFLRRAGYQVTTAFSANDALDHLKASEPFDLLVTDFAMPGANGAELVRQARQTFPSLPMLLMTGNAAEGGLGDIPPDAEVLFKPFSRHQMLEKVKHLIETAARPIHQNEQVRS